MCRKYIDLLRCIGREVIDGEKSLDEAALRFDRNDIDLLKINDELSAVERVHLISDEEADAVRAIFVSLLMKNTVIDTNDLYSIVFEEGEKIVWH